MNTETLTGHRDDLDRLVLSALTLRQAHGYAIADALRSKGDTSFDLPDGVLYLALHRLERAALVSSRWSDVDGRRRRIYQLTKNGQRALARQRLPISRDERLFPKLRNVCRYSSKKRITYEAS